MSQCPLHRNGIRQCLPCPPAWSHASESPRRRPSTSETDGQGWGCLFADINNLATMSVVPENTWVLLQLSTRNLPIWSVGLVQRAVVRVPHSEDASVGPWWEKVRKACPWQVAGSLDELTKVILNDLRCDKMVQKCWFRQMGGGLLDSSYHQAARICSAAAFLPAGKNASLNLFETWSLNHQHPRIPNSCLKHSDSDATWTGGFSCTQAQVFHIRLPLRDRYQVCQSARLIISSYTMQSKEHLPSSLSAFLHMSITSDTYDDQEVRNALLATGRVTRKG